MRLRLPLPSFVVQGDVGCGKTVVAFLAAVEAVALGYQAAIMAPIEFLAHQHYKKLQALFESALPEHLRPSVRVLTASTKKSKALRALIQEGAVDIVVGTHALISKATDYHRLGLAIVDEQHRFGVDQRSRLNEKVGTNEGGAEGLGKEKEGARKAGAEEVASSVASF